MYNAGRFQIITFEEFISIALDATRVVGIYPEIKNPVLINQHVSKPLFGMLCQYDFTKTRSLVSRDYQRS